MNTFSDFENTVDISVLKQWPTASRKFDNQVMVDENMKKKRWDVAKVGKERTAALIAVNQMVLHISNCAMGDLVQLMEQYADLSLAGSCSVRAKSTVRFLEAMENEFNDNDKGKGKLEMVKESLEHMKRKLGLNKIEEDVQKGGSG